MGKNNKSRGKTPGPGSPKGATKGKGGKGKGKDKDDAKRTGLRGAAPWAARHAAKHAAEARARNLSPAPPGSARATLRTPEKAEQIKARVAELHNSMVKIRALRKNLNDKFFELGLILGTIKEGTLYEAKGYSSFETFVEREMDLGKSTSLRLERIPRVFQEPAAKEFGLEALLAALEALENASTPTPRPGSGQRAQQPPTLPMKPPGGKR
jgi:hypothetical protein